MRPENISSHWFLNQGSHNRLESRASVVENKHPSYIEFDGIRIQWSKGTWAFEHPDKGQITKDTYSIWNPQHWNEIADRLASGDKCAMQVAGAYGVGKIFDLKEWQPKDATEKTEFDKLAAIKQGRPWGNNFVAFIHPEDQSDVIDFDRVDKSMRSWIHPQQNLRDPNVRHRAHGWAQHNIYPAKDRIGIDSGLLRADDKSIACFWIKDHWGFEGIVDTMRKKRKHGIFGGGSLNFHGENPGFTAEDLKRQMSERPVWQESIDFVLLDELTEAGKIERSQPMVSFMDKQPKLLRHGSLSVEEIQRRTKFTIQVPDNAKLASSTTPYNAEANKAVDEKIALTEKRIAEFGKFVNSFGPKAA